MKIQTIQHLLRGRNGMRVAIGVFAAVVLPIIWVIRSGFPIECALSDGRVVVCDGILKGEKVSESEFEPNVYAYRGEWFERKESGMWNLLTRIKHRVRYGAQSLPTKYFRAPWVLIGGLKGPAYPSSVLSELRDERDQLLSVDWWGGEPRSMDALNHDPLPAWMRQWDFQFKDHKKQVIGRISVPNPQMITKPLFSGRPAPLDAKSSKGVLKLVSAECSIVRGGDSLPWKIVRLKFDAAGCLDLLPCHVIGARITDSSGGTCLLQGEVDEDGKTVRVVAENDDLSRLSSPDWRVRIGICRGRGVVAPAKDIVNFSGITAIELDRYGKSESKHFASGRRLRLENPLCLRDSASPRWTTCLLHWDLDEGPLRWPIVVKTTAHYRDGRFKDVTPGEIDPACVGAAYSVYKDQFTGGADRPAIFAENPRFKAHFKIPLEVVEFDLQVILEEPTVFEFDVKVSGWPSGERASGD